MERYDFILTLTELIGYWLTHVVAAITQPGMALKSANEKLVNSAEIDALMAAGEE